VARATASGAGPTTGSAGNIGTDRRSRRRRRDWSRRSAGSGHRHTKRWGPQHRPPPYAYWNYFGDRAGPRGEGWYSFDVGAWHVVVLNSECEHVGCDADSDQGQWLAADLADNSARCTLAAFHRPRFSSGDEYGDDESVSDFWQVLQDAGVDVVLNGHEHSYERFAPQRDSGRATTEEGMAEFVVGTGGRNLRGFGDPKPNSEVRWNDSFGVLGLTLRPDGYDWRFHATPGTCRSRAAPPADEDLPRQCAPCPASHRRNVAVSISPRTTADQPAVYSKRTLRRHHDHQPSWPAHPTAPPPPRPLRSRTGRLRLTDRRRSSSCAGR
jgi:hypothetical protein